MKPPQCLTCPTPTTPGAIGYGQSGILPLPMPPAKNSWEEDDWEEEREEDTTEIPSTPPTKKKKEKIIGSIFTIEISNFNFKSFEIFLAFKT